MSEDPIQMGKRLRQARLRAGYATGTEAAIAIGVPIPTYLAHENGSRGFRSEVTRYATFYGVRVDWLLADRGNPTADPVIELFRRIPEAKREEALDFLRFLARRSS